MSESLKVLIIEDSALDARVLVGLVKAGGYEVTSERVETSKEFTTALAFAINKTPISVPQSSNALPVIRQVAGPDESPALSSLPLGLPLSLRNL